MFAFFLMIFILVLHHLTFFFCFPLMHETLNKSLEQTMLRVLRYFCVYVHFSLAYANAQIQDDLRLSVIYFVKLLFTPTYFFFWLNPMKQIGFSGVKKVEHRCICDGHKSYSCIYPYCGLAIFLHLSNDIVYFLHTVTS